MCLTSEVGPRKLEIGGLEGGLLTAGGGMWFRHCSGFVCVTGVNCFTNHVTVLVAVAFLFFCLHRYLLSSLSLSSFSLFLCCHCHHAPVFRVTFVSVAMVRVTVTTRQY